MVFGFLSKKGFISSELRWYFIFSEYNLADERDDNLNEKILPYFKSLESQPAKKSKKGSSSEDDLSEEEKQGQEEKTLQINQLYEYDLKSNLVQKISLLDVVSFTKETQQSPFVLKVTYNIYEEKEEVEDVTKELILQSEYMSEIEKWFKAFEIIYQRYSIAKVREALLEKRYQKFEVKMMKINEETEWRVLGTKDKADFVLVNRETLKVSGHSYKIADISGEIGATKMMVLFKENPNDEGKNKESYVVTLNFKDK